MACWAPANAREVIDQSLGQGGLTPEALGRHGTRELGDGAIAGMGRALRVSPGRYEIRCGPALWVGMTHWCRLARCEAPVESAVTSSVRWTRPIDPDELPDSE